MGWPRWGLAQGAVRLAGGGGFGGRVTLGGNPRVTRPPKPLARSFATLLGA